MLFLQPGRLFLSPTGDNTFKIRRRNKRDVEEATKFKVI
jgi:hypothetical protein